MLKKALVYRFGSMVIGVTINFALFGTVQMALFATFIFTVVLTGYYMAFHALWAHSPPSLPESKEFSLGDTPVTDKEILEWGDSLPRYPTPPDMKDFDI